MLSHKLTGTLVIYFEYFYLYMFNFRYFLLLHLLVHWSFPYGTVFDQTSALFSSQMFKFSSVEVWFGSLYILHVTNMSSASSSFYTWHLCPFWVGFGWWMAFCPHYGLHFPACWHFGQYLVRCRMVWMSSKSHVWRLDPQSNGFRKCYGPLEAESNGKFTGWYMH